MYSPPRATDHPRGDHAVITTRASTMTAHLEPTAASRSHRLVIEGSRRTSPLGLSGWLLSASVFLLPVQVPVGADLRLAPSDAFLGAYLLIRMHRVATRRSAWSVWHAVIVLSLLIGTIVAATRGHLRFYILVQKDLGILTLLGAYLATIDFCRNVGRVAWLCRAFLWGVYVNLVAALVALYASTSGVFDIPFINFSGVRLAGLLIDPNAFGGLLVVAMALHFLPRASGLRLISGLPGRRRRTTIG